MSLSPILVEGAEERARQDQPTSMEIGGSQKQAGEQPGPGSQESLPGAHQLPLILEPAVENKAGVVMENNDDWIMQANIR